MTEKKAALKSPKSKWAVVRPEVLGTTFGSSGDKLKALRIWNILLAVVFALQGIAVWVFGNGNSLPVSVSYLTADPLQTAAQGTTVHTLATHHLFDLNLLVLAVLTLFVAAGIHLLQATAYRNRYETGLSAGSNKLRWIGYAVTAILLMLSVGLIFGVQDIALLVAIASLCVLQNLAGWAVERHDMTAPTRQKLGILSGGLAGLCSLAIIGLYLYGALVDGVATPGYFYGLFVVCGLAFVLFCANVLLRHRGIGKWADYPFVERSYMALYLVITSALAWQIFAGALR